MATRQINAERFSVKSSKSFNEVVAAIDTQVGHPDMRKFVGAIAAARSNDELEMIVHAAVGPTNLMEFARFDQGEILRKELGDKAPRVLRLIIGNPVTMRKMVKHVPDAASYAPVTILIDERPDGVHLSYDRMASLLASYGNSEALKVAQSLDSTVEGFLEMAAG